MTDYYATLGVARDATQDDIKRAFRKLASQHHPDKGGDTAKFQNIQAAYDTLGSADKRAAYDRPQPQHHNNGFHFNFGGSNLHDIFQNFGASPFAARRAPQVRVTVWIDLSEVIKGSSRTLNVSAQGGNTTVSVSIPQGLEDGDSVQYSGVAPNGLDLVVQYRIHPHSWQRQGANLMCDQTVSVWHLILGGTLKVQDPLNNELEVAIPPHTQPGTVMRLRGRGIPQRHGNTGDLLVRLQTQIPANIPEPVLAAIRQHC